MAKQFIDVRREDLPGDATTTFPLGIAIQSGAALTLTHDVRVLWEDTLSSSQVLQALDRAKSRIVQLEQ